MVKQKVLVIDNERDVYVECPHCEHCESHPIDEQRHHLQTFTILDWYPIEKAEDIEVSKMECHVCKKQFELEWDYDNIDDDNDE